MTEWDKARRFETKIREVTEDIERVKEASEEWSSHEDALEGLLDAQDVFRDLLEAFDYLRSILLEWSEQSQRGETPLEDVSGLIVQTQELRQQMMFMLRSESHLVMELVERGREDEALAVREVLRDAVETARGLQRCQSELLREYNGEWLEDFEYW